MKRTITLIILLVSLVLCACGNEQAKKRFSEDPEMISNSSMSVVLLNCYDRKNELYATGSAFQCFENGIFITNYHVIEDAEFIQAKAESGIYFDIDEVVAVSEEKDIAILRTNADPKLNILQAGDSNAMVKGENVVAIGSPEGFINTVSKGTYSGFVEVDGKKLMQFNASVSNGSSGGALFNDNGEVIGVTSASYTEGQNINFAIPISEIAEIWNNTDNYMPPEKPKWIAIDEYFANQEKYVDSEVTIGGYVYNKINSYGANDPNGKHPFPHIFRMSVNPECNKFSYYDAKEDLESNRSIIVYGDESFFDQFQTFNSGDFVVIRVHTSTDIYTNTSEYINREIYEFYYPEIVTVDNNKGE